ncbi:MAG: ATP-binding protein [Gammaproteobacteria bacterium]
MQPQTLFLLDERSQVGNARRAATALAETLGFDSELTGKAGLAITEIGSNVLKHAGSGRLMLRALQVDDTLGIEIIALDKGPGIADVAASLRDGHSTSGTLGGGLGALSRMSSSFEIFTQPARGTQPGGGTAVRLELWAKPLANRTRPIELGGICIPVRGETVSGDDWAVESWRDQLGVLVADGLGHGLSAHQAARAASDTFLAHPQSAPQAVIEECHSALARTRGAAVAVARLVSSAERGSFAGVGNIVCRVEATAAHRHLVSYNGTVGHTLRKLQEFAFPWPVGALLILHSDGLGTHWDLSTYPGLSARHPALIAAVLYRDYDRGRDDVTVVVIRNRGGSPEAP